MFFNSLYRDLIELGWCAISTLSPGTRESEDGFRTMRFHICFHLFYGTSFFFSSVKWPDSFNFCVCHHGGFREHTQPFLTGWPNIYHTATFDGAGVFSAPSLGSTNVNVTRSSSKAKRVTRGSIFHSIFGLFLCGVFNIRWAHFTHDRTLLNTSVQV